MAGSSLVPGQKNEPIGTGNGFVRSKVFKLVSDINEVDKGDSS